MATRALLLTSFYGLGRLGFSLIFFLFFLVRCLGPDRFCPFFVASPGTEKRNPGGKGWEGVEGTGGKNGEEATIINVKKEATKKKVFRTLLSSEKRKALFEGRMKCRGSPVASGEKKKTRRRN